MTERLAHTLPFSAIVGQDALKTALLLNAVDPRVGGVLIRGEKGTAKSTAVRALAGVLPPIDVVEGCRFGCDPAEPGAWCVDCRARREEGPLPKMQRRPRIVDLPVSATEDRLVGTLDFEAALKRGEREFHPGLLASANRGILYVDEVNLLDDHLVDTLLDAAAMGINIVEREGVSFQHPASFILVGTMNPEEGEIRPQLLDRFGLCVDVEAVREPEARVEIVRRRHAFEEDQTGFIADWADAEHDVQTRLRHGHLRLPSVRVPEEVLYAIADLAIRAGVDGHRADSVMARAATANAALEGRQEVALTDIERVAGMVLAHRLKRTPFDDIQADVAALRESLVRSLTSASEEDSAQGASSEAGPGQGQASIFESLGATSGAEGGALEQALVKPMDAARRSVGGRRQESVVTDGRGRHTRSEPARSVTKMSDVAIEATVRSAAAAQTSGAAAESDLAVTIRPEDLRAKVRMRKVGACIVLCVDASGSMGAASRMEAAKSAALDLLVDAYQRRDRVAVVSFRGDSAEVVLPPTASVELANLKLRSLPTGGATPLAAGILRSLEVLEGEARRDPDVVPWLVLLTDGRGNVGIDGGLGGEDSRAAALKARAAGVSVLVVDTASGPTGGGAARDIARAAGAEYVRLTPHSGGIADVVRERL